MSVATIQSEEFEPLIEKNAIVCLDFWAPWCAPCVAFSKVFSEVSKDYPKVVFAQLNIEKSPKLSETFEIRSIPYLMIIKNKVVIYAESGSMPATRLRELIDQALVVEMN